ncbi:MAG: ABC transporter substrate-binding protein [Caldimonas sp.]
MRRAGGSTPIVFAFSGDPVLAKLVDSYARPGGRFTGMSMLSLDLTAKRMELLKELIPNLKRVAILANPAHPGEEAERRASQASAQPLKLVLEYFPVRDQGELEPALARIQQAHCEAIVVFPDAGTMTYSKRIAAFTAQTGIPAISGWVAFAESGNLATYGPEFAMPTDG